MTDTHRSIPDRATAKPTSLPDVRHGHGVIVTLYGENGYDGHAFLKPAAARELRDQIDAALAVVEIPV